MTDHQGEQPLQCIEDGLQMTVGVIEAVSRSGLGWHCSYNTAKVAKGDKM